MEKINEYFYYKITKNKLNIYEIKYSSNNKKDVCIKCYNKNKLREIEEYFNDDMILKNESNKIIVFPLCNKLSKTMRKNYYSTGKIYVDENKKIINVKKIMNINNKYYYFKKIYKINLYKYNFAEIYFNCDKLEIYVGDETLIQFNDEKSYIKFINNLVNNMKSNYYSENYKLSIKYGDVYLIKNAEIASSNIYDELPPLIRSFKRSF